MTAFDPAEYSLHLGDHETTIWCRACTACITGPDGMCLSFTNDRAPLPLPTLDAAAEAHHHQHHGGTE